VFGRLRRLRTRRALSPALRSRLAGQKSRRERLAGDRAVLAESCALARYVAVDLETTGPDMRADTIISVGAVAVTGGGVRHDDAFERVLRQDRASAVDNILVHRIGGQAQAAGVEPASALVDFLDWVGNSVLLAFRAEFDRTVLARELASRLGIVAPLRFVDLAIVLPALFPDRQNDSLDDWIVDCGLPHVERHDAVADAYAGAQLWLLALERARRAGLSTTGDLVALEEAQRWLGKRR
jgi:DNA polymerase-3 subunit epsilon